MEEAGAKEVDVGTVRGPSFLSCRAWQDAEASGHKARTNKCSQAPGLGVPLTNIIFVPLVKDHFCSSGSFTTRCRESRVLAKARTLVKGREQICFNLRGSQCKIVRYCNTNYPVPHSHSVFTVFYYRALDPATGACQGFCLSQPPVTNSPDRL